MASRGEIRESADHAESVNSRDRNRRRRPGILTSKKATIGWFREIFRINLVADARARHRSTVDEIVHERSVVGIDPRIGLDGWGRSGPGSSVWERDDPRPEGSPGSWRYGNDPQLVAVR